MPTPANDAAATLPVTVAAPLTDTLAAVSAPDASVPTVAAPAVLNEAAVIAPAVERDPTVTAAAVSGPVLSEPLCTSVVITAALPVRVPLVDMLPADRAEAVKAVAVALPTAIDAALSAPAVSGPVFSEPEFSSAVTEAELAVRPPLTTADAAVSVPDTVAELAVSACTVAPVAVSNAIPAVGAVNVAAVSVGVLMLAAVSMPLTAPDSAVSAPVLTDPLCISAVTTAVLVVTVPVVDMLPAERKLAVNDVAVALPTSIDAALSAPAVSGPVLSEPEFSSAVTEAVLAVRPPLTTVDAAVSVPDTVAELAVSEAISAPDAVSCATLAAGAVSDAAVRLGVLILPAANSPVTVPLAAVTAPAVENAPAAAVPATARVCDTSVVAVMLPVALSDAETIDWAVRVPDSV
jgi:hypothetical protein